MVNYLQIIQIEKDRKEMGKFQEKVDQKYEELSKEQLDKILLSKNLRKRHPIHINFKISNQVIQIKYDSDKSPEYMVEKTKNGILIFIFDIILFNKSSEKKHKKTKVII